ncbi:unnamed protein product [Sphacelaria rigidula]
MNLSAPCSTPACHGNPPSLFAAEVHIAWNTRTQFLPLHPLLV